MGSPVPSIWICATPCALCSMSSFLHAQRAGLLACTTTKLYGQKSPPLSKWMSYSDCADRVESISEADNLYTMCHDCNLYGKVALGFSAATALMAIVALIQLAVTNG